MSGPERIEFRACAGLANRVRALVSALCLQEDFNVPMRVIWNADTHCGTTFDHLFDVKTLPAGVTIDGNPPTLSSVELTGQKQTESVLRGWKSGCLAIHSHQPFYCAEEDRWVQKLRALRPAPFIEQMLERRWGHLHRGAAEGALVGVHIRRTDHAKSIKNSPRDAFVREMSRYDDKTQFFLVTDCMEERRWFEAKFHGRILCFAASTDRTSLFGMQNAALDFFMLARCDRILGSFASSFSEMAAAYGGVPLDVVRK
jgi:hypothetical protein